MEILKPLLLNESSNLCINISNIDVFAGVLNAWSQTMVPIWDKLIDTTELDYNPIENYTRYDNFTNEGVSDETGNGTNEREVNAFDTENYRPHDKTTGNSTAHNSYTDINTGRSHGNIGVTTTQKMIREERDVVNFNIYYYIINDFASRFLLGVYAN